MFGIDAARPATGELATKSFGLAHSSEGIAEYRFHQLERAQGASPIGARPAMQIFQERRIEYGKGHQHPADGLNFRIDVIQAWQYVMLGLHSERQG